MPHLMQLAFRNIRRNTRRSLLAVLSVALSVMFIVAMQGLVGGFMGSMVKNYTKNETGHIRISTTDFADKIRFHPVTENFTNPASIRTAIMGDPAIAGHIRICTERIHFGVLLNNKGNNKAAMALAGDPSVERDLLLLNKSIEPGGRYIRAEREAVIGAGIAEALGYRVGDTIRAMTQGSDYALHMRKFTIVGIFRSGLKMLDDAVFQIPIDDARKLLRMEGAAQQMIIMLDDYRRAGAVAKAIEAKLNNPDLAVLDWIHAGDYGAIVTITSKVYALIYSVIALLGAFIIGNIMMMVVLERRREIGVLKSMGLQRSEIMFLFLSEGMALGLIGSAAGVALGGGISLFFHFHGMDFTAAMSSVSMPMDSIVYSTVELGGLLQALLIGTIVSACVSLGPSWQAARMNAVEAIKSV